MDKKEIQLDSLMKNRPNIYGNTIVIVLLRLLIWGLAIGFAIAGVLIAFDEISISAFGRFSEPIECKVDSQFVISTCCFLLSIALFLSVRIGRMLLQRNVFIMDLDEWYQENYVKPRKELKAKQTK